MARANNASEVFAKWRDRAQNASAAMKAGAAAVTVAPTEKAAAAKDRWAQGVQRAIADGSFEDGCRRVSLSEWQKKYTDGIANYQNGVRNAEQAMMAHLQDAVPFWRQLRESADAMPKGSDADSDARMLANVRAIKQHYAGRKRR